MAQAKSHDVIVLGSGAAGLSAALTAALNGLSVLVIEKTAWLGGTTAWSGGAAWLPNNPLLAEGGSTDSPELARTYIKELIGNYYDAALIDAFLAGAPEMVDFLQQRSSAMRFQPLGMPDYHPELNGALPCGRSLLPLPYDGRQLGDWLSRLRKPKPEMTVFGGMQVDVAEINHLQNSWRSAKSFQIAAKLLFRYLTDRLRFGRGTRLIRGTALVARLLRSCIDAGVELRTETSATGLIREHGRVQGVIVEHRGNTENLHARRGVVIATGGFSANLEMRREAIPHADQHIVVVLDTNVGEGLQIAASAGAAFGPANAANAIWAPASQRYRSDGALSTYPHFAFDRCKPGAIMVDQSGRRFVNEASSYHTIGNAMHVHGIVPAWLIGDRRFLRKYGMGLARPAPYPVKHLVRSGYLTEAATIDELAAKIGANPEVLRETVQRMNSFARTGKDEDFGKGDDIYSRSLGDPSHKPNPTLGKIDKPPFYALPLYPTDAGTTLGLNTDSNARVLDGAGNIIPGLYATGLDMHSVMRGHYPGAGTMLGPALTFARSGRPGDSKNAMVEPSPMRKNTWKYGKSSLVEGMDVLKTVLANSIPMIRV